MKTTTHAFSFSRLVSSELAFLVVAVLALILAVNMPAHAQSIYGAITGTVRDSSGSVVNDAQITARNLATNLSVTARSQVTGSYSISNLPAGTYELSFTKEGFDTCLLYTSDAADE